MREGTPSLTSFLVAFSRGVGVDRSELDPYAAALLPRGVAAFIGASHQRGLIGTAARTLYRAASLGLVDHITLRTLAIDHHLLAALTDGLEQVVILGAGLDARAWRLPVLRKSRVFEVDHPATQTFKQKRVAALPAGADVEFVTVDFLEERFADKLAVHGFDAQRPAVWIWEGVAMYLTNEAVEDSIRQMTEASAPGSHLVMSYMVPDSLPFGRVGSAITRSVFAAGGEPLGHGVSPEEVAGLLGDAWQIRYNRGSDGWKELTGAKAQSSTAFVAEHLAVAVRQG